MRGYFEIGIYRCKTSTNYGTLWRSAYQLGAAGIFLIGCRFKKQNSDTLRTHRHIPLREYETFEHFLSCRPYDCPLVAIETGGKPLRGFKHPHRAVYLLGAEDHGLPKRITDESQHVVSIESVNTESYNVAVAGAIVMYHRILQNSGEENGKAA